jgi:SAM-dependent methyltransferase
VESIECVLCESSTSEPVIEENGFVGRQCARCGLIFISPRPSREEMEEVYESGEAYLPPEFFATDRDSHVDRVHARRAVRRLQRHVAGGSLLEIGPGSGMFLAEAHRAGFDVCGVELNPTQAAFIRKRRGVPCVSSLEEASSLGPKRFDVVYHRDVLSHFYDPLAEFRKIHELLVAGGHHVFETGNGGDTDHKYFRHFKSFQYPDHLFFYSIRSLDALLQQTGFARVHTYRYSILPEMVLHTQLRHLVRRLRSRSGSEIATPSNHSSAHASGGVAQTARNALDYVSYSLRYSVGALATDDGHPQSLIVVARKAA